MITLLLFTVFGITLLAGIPIAFCLGLSSLAIVLYQGQYPITIIAQKMFQGMDLFALMAIPLFILAGDLMNLGGVTDRLIKFSNLLVGHIRGGLAHVTVVVGMFFAGISGSSTQRMPNSSRYLARYSGTEGETRIILRLASFK